MSFKIITLNTWSKSGPYQKRFTAMQAETKRLHPDVVCFQEVFDPELSEFISKSCDFKHVFTSYPAGLVTLSRFPFIESSQVKYQTQSSIEDNDRRCTLVRIDLPNISIWIGNTHLSWKPDDREARSAQTKELLELTLLRGPQAFLSGDFNDVPSSPALRQMQEAGFVDTFHKLHPNKDGFTWDNARNPFLKTHSVTLPDRRIDHIFAYHTLLKEMKLLSCEMVFTEAAQDSTFPTDHFGWCATFA